MEGGDGLDTLSYAGSMDWVTVLLDHGISLGVEGYGDTFTGFENIRGGEVSDALYGNAGANTIVGGAGGDFISGAGGTDVLFGGVGDDAFFYFGFDSGIEKIMDFLPGGGWEDRISMDMGGYDTFDEVMALATMSGADTVIDFGSGLRLILVGVDKAALTTQDFIFTIS
jgi:Ca2+-binding RTX toxin-like protein